MKVYDISGFICSVGENNKENWELLKRSRKKNLFLRLSDFPVENDIMLFPSPFVILSTYSVKEIDEKVVVESARVCWEHSAYSGLKGVKVDVTTVSNVGVGKKGELVYFDQKKVKRIRVGVKA